MDDDNQQKVRNYALKLLSFRPRSIQEVKQKLDRYTAKKNIPQKVNEKVISNLIAENLLNDSEFAKWWIDQRQRVTPKGIRAIRYELRLKGVSNQIIDELLSAQEKDSELVLAKKIAEKLIAKERHFANYDRLKLKISQFLSRRGFDFTTIEKVIDSLPQKR